MADTGRQSPLAVNVLGSVLQNRGLTINKPAAGYMGESKINTDYTMGSIVSDTCLRLLTWAINDGYNRGEPGPPETSVPTISNETYDNLIAIGADSIPALGNSLPPTYVPTDPANVWARVDLDSPDQSTSEKYGIQQGIASSLPGPATSTYPVTSDEDQGQEATWYPYDHTNPNKSVTQWGYVRLHALQAWNEFNYNGDQADQANAEYKEFLSSFMTAHGFASDSNHSIHVIDNSDSFMDGIYSNMNDLTSADIAGLSLSGVDFGTDLENLGKVIDLRRIETFGMPSNLLMVIGAAGAMTQDLGLALLASGLSKEEISSLSNGVMPNWSKELEQKILGAFLVITGENLAHVLAPLQCRTQGIETLADLLNVQKLFPISYSTLTVPVYNGSLGLPTNSKTYYLIYENGGVNPSLNSQEIQEYVGTIIPKGLPPTFSNTTTPDNFAELPMGFSSYLDGIIPSDWALAAGAFSYAMRQVKNIENVKFSVFAKVAKGLENMADLPLINGTSKPTDQEATDDSMRICSLGSGQAGSYTMSDFFGCMSGLPYPWKLIQERISQLETQKLYNIYEQLFLAVTWEEATATIDTNPYYTNVQQYIANAANPDYPAIDPTNPYLQCGTGTPTTNPCCQPRIDNCYYNLTIDGDGLGGGYGRGTAVAPTVTISPNPGGASLTTSVGSDSTDAGSVNDGTFGRLTFGSPNSGSAVLYKTVTNSSNNNPPDLSGPDAPPSVTITVQAPPIEDLPVDSNGDIATDGVNSPSGTAGWPSTMDAVVQKYIDQANEEIQSILESDPDNGVYLILYWELLGKQLAREQRTRYTFLNPVPVPKDYFMNQYPNTCYTFLDSLAFLSQDTRPHMTAQTIEAISDLDTIGGQSVVGKMREERNQARLQQLGVPADNNIDNTMSPIAERTLLANGTIPGATSGSGITSLNPNIDVTTGEELPSVEYTIPAWYSNEQDGEIIEPQPEGYYIPAETLFDVGGGTSGTGGTNDTGGTSPGTASGVDPTQLITPGFQSTDETQEGDITPILIGDPNPVVNIVVPAGPVIVDESPIDEIVIIAPPPEYNLDNLPSNLDPNYTSSTLLPATLSIQKAIEHVITCNCDCWVK